MAYRIYVRGKAKNRIQALEIENNNPYTIEIRELISAIKNFGLIRFLTFLFSSLTTKQTGIFKKWVKDKEIVEPEIREVPYPVALPQPNPYPYSTGTGTGNNYGVGDGTINTSGGTFTINNSEWKYADGGGNFLSDKNNSYTSSSGNDVYVDWNHFDQNNNQGNIQ